MTTTFRRLRAILALIDTSGLGMRRVARLVEYFGDLTDIPLDDHAKISEITGLQLSSIPIPEDDRVSKMEKYLDDTKSRLIVRKSEEFPAGVFSIDTCPEYLFVRGEIIPADSQALAVVGTRKPCEYGVQVTRRFSEGAVRAGMTIVSGLANGVDTQAHKAALRSGGRTIAVLGCGLDVVYPPDNRKLYTEIPAHGAIITEHPPGTRPEKHNFPARNRLISGLSLGVLVAAAPPKSGSLITADYALEQGKPVFTVPGSIFDKNLAGNNNLLKKGAIPVTDPDDILQEFGMEKVQLKSDAEMTTVIKGLTQPQQDIFKILSAKPMHIDVITKRTGIRTSDVLAELTNLLIQGFIEQRPGGNYVRIM